MMLRFGLVAMVMAVGAAFGETSPAVIPFRGVVEGYYGRPWGTEGRLSLLKFMGEQKMNVFIYGPKDDPYHHAKWREEYPEKEMKDFARLLAVAKENGINFYWAIHLGGTFKEGYWDYRALFKKLDFMYDAGFRSFAVFFDDFGAWDASLHARICNRIVKEFLDVKGDCAPLIMCPSAYWGDYDYQRTLGDELDRKVNIMWTGRGICSDITADAVKKVTANFKRPPFVWWNWPVNDYCRTKVLLGRTYGLDACPLAGFVSNPMENCEANKIALYGIAKWCLDPQHFDSQKTWEESFAVLYPDPEIARAMRIFAEHNSDQARNNHGYRREESVAVAPLCAQAREEYAKTGTLSPQTAEALTQLFDEVVGACATLLNELPRDKGLGWELEGWLRAEEAQMFTGLEAIKLLQATDPRVRDARLNAIRTIRRNAEKAADEHRAKFAAATFPNDAQRVKSPEASTLVLKPTVELILEGELRKLYKAKTGKDIDAATGLAAFSTTKAMANLTLAREGHVVGINALLEPREVKPGETFGLTVPASWQTTYVHARLGNENAQKKGVVEVSTDGKAWQTLDFKREGGQIHGKLDPKAGWRQARYRNASDETVTVKLNLFKFDVLNQTSAIDSLLEALK